MDNATSTRPAAGRRVSAHLQSASGAFDLPSILIGVAVVAILAIGVMATIFGVIPWAQNNAAKQDLTALYTAQGTAYARDDQQFKDLGGLENAGLISDLDPEKVVVTVSEDGKGFQAVVTASTGKKWFITHDNPTPREWEDKTASRFWLNTPAWASDYCTPAVVEMVMIDSAYSHPGVFEMLKRQVGLTYDQDLMDQFLAVMNLPRPEMTEQEGKALEDLMNREPSLADLRNGFLEISPSSPDEVDMVAYAAARSEYVSSIDALMISFCHP